MTPEQRAVEEFKAKVREVLSEYRNHITWADPGIATARDKLNALLAPAEPDPPEWAVEAAVAWHVKLAGSSGGCNAADLALARIIAKHAPKDKSEGLVAWLETKHHYEDVLFDVERYLRGER